MADPLVLPAPLTGRTVHLCVDMQRIFSSERPWATPWMGKVLPVIVAIAERFPENASQRTLPGANGLHALHHAARRHGIVAARRFGTGDGQGQAHRLRGDAFGLVPHKLYDIAQPDHASPRTSAAARHWLRPPRRSGPSAPLRGTEPMPPGRVISPAVNPSSGSMRNAQLALLARSAPPRRDGGIARVVSWRSEQGGR
jgi:hypothetical protein